MARRTNAKTNKPVEEKDLADVNSYYGDGSESDGADSMISHPAKKAATKKAKDSKSDGKAEGETVKKPKRVLGPRAKLDPERLCGKMGLPALVKDFEKTQWHPRGLVQKEDVSKAEEERLNLMNLQLMMKKMEEWAHRMFPKSRFDDTLEKIEHLGNKRPVKTCVRKLLQGYPVLPEDFVGSKDAEGEIVEWSVFDEADPRVSAVPLGQITARNPSVTDPGPGPGPSTCTGIRSGITTGGMTKAPAGDTVHTSGTHGAMSYSFQGEEDVQFPDDMEFPDIEDETCTATKENHLDVDLEDAMDFLPRLEEVTSFSLVAL